MDDYSHLAASGLTVRPLVADNLIDKDGLFLVLGDNSGGRVSFSDGMRLVYCPQTSSET